MAYVTVHGSSMSDGESNKEAILMEGDTPGDKTATVNMLIRNITPASMKISKNTFATALIKKTVQDDLRFVKH